MLTYSDVSADPSAFERSNLRQAQLEEAQALGFGLLAWIATTVDDAPPDVPAADRGFVTAVMSRAGAPLALSIAHVAEVGDDYCLKTLFTDGSVVMTESEPQRNRFRLMLGVSSAPQHGVHLAFVAMKSLAHLVECHLERVRAHSATGVRPAAQHDLRAYLAMKKRWREIADARMRLQMKIAVVFGFAVLGAIAILPAVASRTLTAMFGETFAHLVRTAGIVGCVPIGVAAFTFGMYYVAPILARVASAPAMRPANELMGLASSVGPGRLEPATAHAPARIAVSSAELARLQRRDLLVTMLGAHVFPAAALGSMATLGVAGAWVVLSVLFAFDGIVTLLTRKTLVAILRERFVPELVRAEASLGGAACAGAACLLPKWLFAGLRLVLGTLGMLAIPRVLSLPREPVSMTAIAQWSFVLVILFATTLAQTKKRHKQLVAAH